jgi:DNA-binding HxlR family transcriptional regulator
MPSTPTGHYQLTTKQLALLTLTYRFRFTTSSLLSQATHISQNTINKRLKLLLEQEYLGRNYKPSYKLQGKPASYYLLPKGIKALKQLNEPTKYSSTILRNINKDKDASERFINHSLDVLSVYCTLKAQHGHKLQFFTKSQLASYPHFPQPLPDAYLRLSHGEGKTQFFLDVFQEHPFFLVTRKVKQYAAYVDAQKDEWVEITNTSLPAALLVCENESLQKRLTKKMRRTVQEVEDDMQFYAITKNAITQNGTWQKVNDIEEVLPLSDIV